MSANPFGVFNPEQLDANYIARNFVDVYTDLPALRERSNTFILGARGSGKSMLLRSLEPEVMLITEKALGIMDLPYLAVHVPLKKAEFAIPELSKLAGFASVSLGEHLLVMHSMFRLMGLMKSLSANIGKEEAGEFKLRFDELFALSANEMPSDQDVKPTGPSSALFHKLQSRCEREIMRVRQYFARLSFASRVPTYTGALTGFLDFLVPLVEQINTLSGLPRVPVFLMLDDADNLPRTMQQVLNSWVSARTTHAVCLKITTQLGYATLRTIDNRVIESPHDFSEVNLAAVYTTDQDRYSKRIKEIVVRRLELAGIEIEPDTFFAEDEQQKALLAKIESDIRDEWAVRNASDSDRKGPARVRDDVTRYAVPRLMRQLTGDAKSSHTFSYAGFKSLVDLSSGVVRWFLEPASRMYDRESESGKHVEAISVRTQDEIIFEWSREFINRLTEIKTADTMPDFDPDSSLHAYGHETIMYEKVKNLTDGLGRLFRSRLLDENSSEQRAFSVVVRGKMPDELRDVLGLAVRLGYLQTADNAAKETLGGRLPRYVLARRLGPYYRLDISGYAAHLSVHAQDLSVAIRNPSEFVASRLKHKDDRQLALELDRS